MNEKLFVLTTQKKENQSHPARDHDRLDRRSMVDRVGYHHAEQ